MKLSADYDKRDKASDGGTAELKRGAVAVTVSPVGTSIFRLEAIYDDSQVFACADCGQNVVPHDGQIPNECVLCERDRVLNRK